MAARVTLPCGTCGADVIRRASDVAYYARTKNTKHVFCSKECSLKLPRKPKTGSTRKCEVCGSDFYSRKHEGDRKYCSKECHDISQIKPKVVRQCAECGVTIELKPSQAIGTYGRFCGIKCRGAGRTTRRAGFDYNGRPAVLDYAGYVRVWQPDHPRAGHGRVLHHRLIFEQALGRYLTTDEQVDHINRIKTDNRLENLQLLSASDHSVKTNGDRLRDVQEAKDVMAELEEYRKRFGPLK